MKRAWVAALFALVLSAGVIGRGHQAAAGQVSPGAQLETAIKKEVVDGDLKAALEMYRKLAESSDRGVAARALLRMGECYEKLGDTEARKAYERVVTQFPDQKDTAAEARRHLASRAQLAKSESGLVERQLWPGDQLSIVGVSADGRFAAFLEWGTDGLPSRIVLKQTATGEERRVGEPGFRCGAPRLSADAGLLAYRCEKLNPAEPSLRVLRLDGSSARVLVSGPESPWPEDWSPDGTRILARLARTNRPWDMVLVSVADGSTQVLKSGGGVGGNTTPRFSPDGRYIVHSANRVSADGTPGVNTLHIMKADGSGEVPLIEGGPSERDWGAVWAPDGHRIVYLSDRSGTTALWTVTVIDGKPKGAPELLKAESADTSLLSFDRSGTLYVQRKSAQMDVYTAAVDPPTGRILTEPRRVNDSYVGSVRGPLAWSLDGKWLAYNRAPNGSNEVGRVLVIRSIDTGQEREFPQAPPFVVGWFPDGQSLLAGNPLGRVDVKTGQVQKIDALERARAMAVGSSVALSRDGNSVFYSVSTAAPNSDGTYTVRLLRHQLDSGEERQIYETKSALRVLHSIAPSPDGRRVAVGETLHVRVVEVETGEARELFNRSIWGIVWSNDGRSLLVRGMTTDMRERVFSVPVDGSEIRTMDVRPWDAVLALHPDGRQLAFVDGKYESRVVAIKNLLAQ